jgi:hypothetical protein
MRKKGKKKPLTQSFRVSKVRESLAQKQLGRIWKSAAEAYKSGDLTFMPLERATIDPI